MQVVYREVELPIEEIDYRAIAVDEVQSLLSDYLLREKARKLDLTQAPLLRLHLFYLPGGEVRFHMDKPPYPVGRLVLCQSNERTAACL